jgi:glycosyltransferase involved in cell wall biosynthesis
MNLIIDARMINHSGIGVYLKNIIQEISSSCEITLLGDPEILQHLYGNITVIPFKANIYSIAEQIGYTKLIPESDLFWSPHYNVPLFNIKSKKRIVTIHDTYHLAYYNTLNFKQKLYASAVMKKAVKDSDAVLTVSDFSRQEIINYTGCKTSKLKTIYNGVRQTPLLNNITDIKKKYHLPSHYILFVGNVKPHKNLKILLKAYVLLNEGLRSQFKIVIVGKKHGFITEDGELLKWIANDVRLSTNTIFTGYVDDDDIDTIYSNASAFVFPSLYEGFGFPPLEAMLNHCATIVSKLNSLAEVCGDAALYFPPTDENSLARQLSDMLTNQTLKAQLIGKGIERVKLFNWKQSAEQHLQVFNQVITETFI